MGPDRRRLAQPQRRPIGAEDLTRNAKSVVALTARYNYTLPECYEEVDRILLRDPLHAF
jgi:hypothetical protein